MTKWWKKWTNWCCTCSRTRRSTAGDFGMATTRRRALHFVLKIGDRPGAIKFFKELLGMRVLRHEEFDKGCDATCNGPYDGKWSKTMMGFGCEDRSFVLELTYNYGINEYRHGNDYVAIEVIIKDASAIKATGAEKQELEGDVHAYVLENNGYRFNVIKSVSQGNKINRVILATSDLGRTMDFYTDGLEMTPHEYDLMYTENQCRLQFKSIEGKMDRGHAFGRIAFACPTEQLKGIEEAAMKSAYGESVQTPFLTLPTPGKADVHVVILADPDLHEICFVGDEGFRELSKEDPNADKLLEEAMAADKSDEWFAKKGFAKGKQVD